MAWLMAAAASKDPTVTTPLAMMRRAPRALPLTVVMVVAVVGMAAAAGASSSCVGQPNIAACDFGPCQTGLCFQEDCLLSDNVADNTSCTVGAQAGRCDAGRCVDLLNTTAAPATTPAAPTTAPVNTNASTTSGSSNATTTPAPSTVPSGCAGRAQGTLCTPSNMPCLTGACFSNQCFSGSAKPNGTACVVPGAGVVGACGAGRCLLPAATVAPTIAPDTTQAPTQQPPAAVGSCKNDSSTDGSDCRIAECQLGKCFGIQCFQAPFPEPDGTGCRGDAGVCFSGVCEDVPTTTTVTTATTSTTTVTTTATTTTTTTTSQLPQSCLLQPNLQPCRASPCVVGTCLEGLCLRPDNPASAEGEPCVDVPNVVLDGVCDANNKCKTRTTGTATGTTEPATTAAPVASCLGQPDATRCNAGECRINAACAVGVCLFERDADDGTACQLAGGQNGGQCVSGACTLVTSTTSTATTTTATTTSTTATTTTTVVTTTTLAEPPANVAVVSGPLTLRQTDDALLTDISKRALVALALRQTLEDGGQTVVNPFVVIAGVTATPASRRARRAVADIEVDFHAYVAGNVAAASEASQIIEAAAADGSLANQLRTRGVGVDSVETDDFRFTLNSITGLQTTPTTAAAVVTTAAASTASDTDDNLVIALSVVAAVLVIAALLAVCLVMRRREQHRQSLYSMEKNAPLPPATSRRNPKVAPLNPGDDESKVDNFTVARQPGNVHKNRYRDVLPYDRSRVVLKPIDPTDQTPVDFVNASWIPGYDAAGPQYISAQGPTRNTAGDFWHMVCQHHVNVIVMLARQYEAGKEKVFQYWPAAIGQPMTFGGFSVSLDQEEQYSHYVYREITVRHQRSGKGKQVVQLQFLSWPDHDVPSTTESMTEFRDRLEAVRERSRGGPLLVHCSAGVGRSGCFICFDREMQRYQHEGSIDVFDCVVSLRQSRPHMVQTASQYVFAHQLLLNEIERHEAETDAPLPGISKDKADFLRSFTDVQSPYGPFDIGSNGREFLHLGMVSLRTKKGKGGGSGGGGEATSCTIAVFNDVVLLTRHNVGLGKYQLICKPTQRPKVVVQDLQHDWDEALFSVKLASGTYILEAPSELEKDAWIQRLTVGDDYIPTKHLRGPRLVSRGGHIRRTDIARLLDVPDPFTQEGAATLAQEWQTIPRLYTANVKILPPVVVWKSGSRDESQISGGKQDALGDSEVLLGPNESYLVSEDGYITIDPGVSQVQARPADSSAVNRSGRSGSGNRRSWFQFAVRDGKADTSSAREPMVELEEMLRNDPAERERLQIEALERDMAAELEQKQRRADHLAKMARHADALAVQAQQIVQMAERPLQQFDQDVVLDPTAPEREEADRQQLEAIRTAPKQMTRRASLQQLGQAIGAFARGGRRGSKEISGAGGRTLPPVPSSSPADDASVAAVGFARAPGGGYSIPAAAGGEMSRQTSNSGGGGGGGGGGAVRRTASITQAAVEEPERARPPRRKIFDLGAVKEASTPLPQRSQPPRRNVAAARPPPQQHQRQQQQPRAASPPPPLQKTPSFTLTRAAMTQMKGIAAEEPVAPEPEPEIACTYLGNCQCKACVQERA